MQNIQNQKQNQNWLKSLFKYKSWVYPLNIHDCISLQISKRLQ